MIDPGLIVKLRERTSAGMSACKSALMEAGGDLDKAVEILRTKGLSSAAKKAGRVALQGMIGLRVAENEQSAVMVELNSETDFVARNSKFLDLVNDILVGLEHNPTNDMTVASLTKMENGYTISESIAGLISVVGENVVLRRIRTMKLAQKGFIAKYVHNKPDPTRVDIGAFGVLVAIECGNPTQEIRDAAKNVAMHLAAMLASTPAKALKVEDLPVDIVNSERAIYLEQLKSQNKPPAVMEKIIEGKMQKFYKEVVLLEQDYLMDNTITIKQLLENLSKSSGSPVNIADYAVFAIGETKSDAAEEN